MIGIARDWIRSPVEDMVSMNSTHVLNPPATQETPGIGLGRSLLLGLSQYC